METLTLGSPAPVVTLALEGPRPQRRLTVAFRVILAIPHFVYFFLVGFALTLAVVAAWFAALVLGRMPAGLGTFISRAVQYNGRVTAYAFLLLTDRYPSFALDAPDYPVSVEVPWGGRLNRAAVLFRGILLIPASIVCSFVWQGLAVVAVFVWLIVVVAGRLPRPLFEAYAAVLRYVLRVTAYGVMLTSEYPRGLFGDRGLSSDEDAPVAEAPAAFEHDPYTVVPMAAPRVTKLVLSKAAKRIVGLFIVLGVVFGIGVQVLAVMKAGEADRARAALADAFDGVYTASIDYGSSVQGCALNQGGLPCLQDAAGTLEAAFAEFRTTFRDIVMPATVVGGADRVDAQAVAVMEVLGSMRSTQDPNEYGRLAGRLQQALEDFDEAVAELDAMLLVAF